MQTCISLLLALTGAVGLPAAAQIPEYEMPDIDPIPDSVTVLSDGERIPFTFRVANYHYEDWGFSDGPNAEISDSLFIGILAEPDKPVPVSFQILTGFEETSHSDSGGQIESLHCDFHKELSEQNNYIVFKANRTKRDISGRLVINLVAFMRDSESGHRYRRFLSVKIAYYQPYERKLSGGRIESAARYNASRNRYEINETEPAEGGMGKIIYRWEYDNGTGWKTLEDNDRYGTYVYVPTAIAGLRCYVRRVAVSGNLSDASNLCVIKRDDSFFADRNYIRKRTFTGTGVNDRITDLTYYDGLGYPEQSVQVAASPQGKDLIIPITYDSMHRNDALSYLPYVGVNSNGKFDTDALTGQKNFYRA